MIWSVDILSVVNVLWAFLALVFLSALLAHKFSPHAQREHKTWRLYVLFQDLIRYGKTKQAHIRDDCMCVIDVPKRWFWHFYAVSVGWNGLLLVLHLNFIFHHQSFPTWLTGIVDILTGVPSTDSQAPQLSTLLMQLLLCVHSLRRLLECLCVSVFSDGAMHLVQYVFGLVYYVALGFTVLCSDRLGKGTGTLLSQLNWFHVVAVTLFIWASLLQHQSTVLLARLRTGKSGAVETLAHRLPNGGWFDLVSCPHYFAELLIYISLSLVFGGLSLTWWLVVLYVLFNQALASQLCHEFYIGKYESYPSYRKAFIPFLL
ncbi:polyprenol reductase [Brachionichthys hirsutus]|uniref:polyprenol reductase n=1 Tax=Brachionichthys hirsutus TaxID=412623 RepID=UPI0036049C4E